MTFSSLPQQNSPSSPDDIRARERALRLLGSIEELAADILLSAAPSQSSQADGASRLVSDAEHTILEVLDGDPDAAAAQLINIRRRLRAIDEDLSAAGSRQASSRVPSVLESVRP